MTFRWDPSGSARLAFNAEMEAVNSRWENPFQQNLNQNLIQLQQWALEEELGSSLFFRAVELIQTMKPEELEFDDTPELYTLLVLVLLLEKEEQDGRICVSQSEILDSLNEALEGLKLEHEIYSREALTGLLSSDKSGWLIGGPETELPLILEANKGLFYFRKSWKLENSSASLFLKKADSVFQIPDENLLFQALEDILLRHPVRYKEDVLKLNSEQFLAVFSAAHSSLMFLSGGPGTGKTSITVCLLRLLKRLGLATHPMLAAPTGRAAKRMSESIAASLRSIQDLESLDSDRELLESTEASQTLHRLLGFHPGMGRFQAHEYAPLEGDLLLVDEASMIDLALMQRLLRAMDSKLPYLPPVRQMILIGDSRQLPPVKSGSPFNDMAFEKSQIPSEVADRLLRLPKELMPQGNFPVHRSSSRAGFSSVHLRLSFRQNLSDPSGRSIQAVADFLRNPKKDETFGSLFDPSQQSKESFFCIRDPQDFRQDRVTLLEQQNSVEEMSRFCRYWANRYFSDSQICELLQKTYFQENLESHHEEFKQIIEHLNAFRVLCLTKVSSTGTDWINRSIEQHSPFHIEKERSNQPIPASPVICTRNQYEFNLMNGDQGIRLKFASKNPNKIEVKALFQVEGQFKTFYDQQLNSLELAYAITVHKSQGSEYEHVAVILPNEESNTEGRESDKGFRELQNLEMLYTAITRARRSAIVVGQRQVLKKALQRRVKRRSGLIHLFSGQDKDADNSSQTFPQCIS